MKRMNNREYYDILHKSPMFQLSMSSKELFHSNFLYWISTFSREMFKDVIKGLYDCVNKVSPTDLWPDNFEVKREAYHFDLCVVAPIVIRKKPQDEIIFILENKVKSIPSLTQLKEYTAKSQKADGRLLLSLSDSFYGMDELLSNEFTWTVVNYNMLSKVLYRLVNDKYAGRLTEYQTHLLTDYSEFIQVLHKLQESWNINKDTPFYCNVPQLTKLRIADLKDKVRFSRMCALLSSCLNNISKVVYGADRDTIFLDNSSKIGSIFIGWGMTRSQGLLEIKILIETNVVLLIQIQGDQYRHGIELYESGKSHKENWEHYSNNQSSGWFLKSFKQSSATIYPKNKEYNKFGNEFIYRSIKIPTQSTIGDVINMIKADCSDILDHINRY